MRSLARVLRPSRVVLLWALLAGLFLMHGAGSPAGGCMSGMPMTAMSLSTTAPPAATAMTAASTMVRPTVSGAQATGMRAGAHVMDVGHRVQGSGGMLCVTRQPGAVAAGPEAAPPIPMAVPGAEREPTVPDAASVRVDRPPGRAGLPLPLFLCVSRT